MAGSGMTRTCGTIWEIPDGQRDPAMSQRAGRAEAGGVEAVVKQRAQKRTCGKGGRMHPHTLPAPVLDGGGCADWFGRHENVRFQENPGQEGANCVGISQGTTCGLKEDCLDMLMSAWIWEAGDGRKVAEDL